MSGKNKCTTQQVMMCIRPARPEDISDLYQLAKHAGQGLTTLPQNKQMLEKRITQSGHAFSQASLNCDQEASYLMVLEDIAKKKVVGTSGVFVGVGLSKAFYTYRILTLTQMSSELGKRVRSEVLTLSNDFTGATEIGTLFLDPEYRCHGNGALLSRCRYLLMAAFKERFSELVMAEMRGWLDAQGHSPFWEALGRHFFQLPFSEADYISGIGNNQFIADLMPHYPIYIQLLPDTAQRVIGETHDQTRPALAMLQKEGFRFAKAVDIFDAGPVLDVPLQDIQTVKASQKAYVTQIVAEDPISEQSFLVANTKCHHFRVLRTSLAFHAPSQIILSEHTASLLQVQVGEEIIYAP